MNIFELTRILNEMSNNTITNIQSAQKAGRELKNKVDNFIDTNVDVIRHSDIEGKKKVGQWMVKTISKANNYLDKAYTLAQKWDSHISSINVLNTNVLSALEELSDSEKEMFLNFVSSNFDSLKEVWNSIVSQSGNRIELYSLFSKYGIQTPKELRLLFIKIFEIADYTKQPRIGKGEVLLCALFGGKMLDSDTGGDCNISGKKIEVKTKKGSIGEPQRKIIEPFENVLKTFLQTNPLVYTNINSKNFVICFITNTNEFTQCGLGTTEPKLNSGNTQDLYWKLK